MLSLCQAARSTVEVRGEPMDSSGNVEWLFRSDGPPANAEQLSWLQAPFSTTRHARFGLGLAFARRLLELQGGRIVVGEGPQGGIQIALVLPCGPSNE
jgi:C4-dicarboxylate-specific signal transduction histidine kinase